MQGPDKFDATLQNPMLDAVAASKPDALLVAPNDVKASAPPLKRMQDKGTKIVLVDTIVTDPASVFPVSPPTTTSAARRRQRH